MRDSHHIGVSYGTFDHFRLIDTLRILPKKYAETEEPVIGIEYGGIHNAEALLLARYFMFTQVYMHGVRRIYDIHLKNFMKEWLTDGKIKNDICQHQNLTDSKIIAAMIEAHNNPQAPGHNSASRIINREHFKLLYQRKPSDLMINHQPGRAIFQAAKEKFGRKNVEHDRYSPTGSVHEFPVLYKDGSILSSLNVSESIDNLPLVSIDYVFVSGDILDDADTWLDEKKEEILKNN